MRGVVVGWLVTVELGGRRLWWGLDWTACSFGRTGTYLRIVVLGGGGGHVGLETAEMGYVVI